MSNQNGIITAPVSLHADVYPVLGLAKTGTFYDLATVCANAHGRINKWSKRKPVRYNSPAELTEEQFRDALYGMNITYSSDLDTVINAAKKGDWDYLPPRPGTDWSRLTDFINYNHYCVRPCTSRLMNQDMEENQAVAANVMFQETTQDADSIRENLNLKKIMVNGQLFEESYMCIVVIDKNGNKIYGATSDNNFGLNNNAVRISTGGTSIFDRGDYTMIPLISSIRRNMCFFVNGQSWSGGWYATLPTLPGTLSVRAWDDIDFKCVANWKYTDGKRSSIEYNLYYTNRTSQPVNIGPVQLRCGYYDQREENDPVKVYLWTYKVNSGENIIIPANTENADPRLGGSIDESLIGQKFNNEQYFIELSFTTTYVENWTYNVAN